MIQDERIKQLNGKRVRRGAYVLYWMQSSQRAEFNHALEFAVDMANELNQPLVAFFGLTDRYPRANLRHYRFMLEGLAEVRDALERRNIALVVRLISPEQGAVEMSRDASLTVVDRGYLKLQRRWRSYAASRLECPLIQVESDVVVPVEEASRKEEYAAATFRPRIKRVLEGYLVPLRAGRPKKSSLRLDPESLSIDDPQAVLDYLDIDRKVAEAAGFCGGISEAKAMLDDFIERRLDLFPRDRNDPSLDGLSGMSPYLHFGQISPLYIALRVLDAGGPGVEPYLEELIVRRELSMNFVFYNRRYDSLAGLPDWARKTLDDHSADRRDYLYSRREFEEARTHDPYWNAAQKQMLSTGKMHGYMRMYWGKKILEWSKNPQTAHRTALYLNDKYELDGRDPNGYTGVLWCFGKHDRAWKERKVTGKIRYMSAGGLRRKFDIEAYARRME